MLKDKKLDYQKQLEEYLEDQQVYDIFEDMMKGLIMSQPKDPIQFLLNKLTSPEVKRLIIVGPPGSKRKEIALSLAEYMSEDLSLVCISVGDLLNKEISKKSEFGKQIVESRKTYSYVKDEIVTELVKGQIEALEKDQKSWIIEGFPRTRQQALAFQKMGIILDKFILLDVAHNQSIEKVGKNLKSEEAVIQFKDEVIGQVAENALTEYKIQIEGVRQTCKGQITEIDGNRPEGVILEEIVRILKLSRSNGPRRPPRIFIMGPPGCGKTQYAVQLAQRFQLQYVKVKHIIKDTVRKEDPKSIKAISLKEGLQSGQFPDELIIDVVRDRLNKPDCKINGFILDGCPTTPDQIMKLADIGITPSLVVVLNQSDALTYERLSNLSYDPIDNRYYNLQTQNSIPPNIQSRLTSSQDECAQERLKQRLETYTDFLTTVESEYQRQLVRINAEEDPQKVFLNLCEAVEKPINYQNIPTVDRENLTHLKQNMFNNTATGCMDYNFLAHAAIPIEAARFISNQKVCSINTNAQHPLSLNVKQKTSKSSDKHSSTKQSQQPQQQNAQKKVVREKEVKSSGRQFENQPQKNIKTKRSVKQQQPINLNLKENLYSPAKRGIQEQVFNQTMLQPGLQNFSLGNISDRHHHGIDLSQTQHLNLSKFMVGSNQLNNHNQTLKADCINSSSSNDRQQNFDFGCSLRMPASTKNINQKQKIGDNDKSSNGGNKNSFFSNAHLREFMTNMNNASSNFKQPFFTQNLTVNTSSKVNKSNNPSAKRKPSNSSSKNQIVPVLDMKKMISAKQIQNIMKSSTVSQLNFYIDQASSKRDQDDNPHDKTPQNHLSNIADSTLYKNLTQKLIKEQQQMQQQQQQITTTMSSQKNLGYLSTTSSKFSLMKKQPTPTNKGLNISAVQNSSSEPGQKRFFSNTKQPPQIGQQSIPITSTNRNQKTFNFDLSNQQQVTLRKSGITTSKNQIAKKKLNLTGTLPKGLLSPTNNGTNKHKHSEYFESTNTQEMKSGNQKSSKVTSKQVNNSQLPLTSQADNKQNLFNIEYMLYQQQIDHFNQMIINIENPNSCKYHQQQQQQQPYHQQQQQQQQPQPQWQHQFTDNQVNGNFSGQKVKPKLNQTAKIERTSSISPGIEQQQQTYQYQNYPQPKHQNYKSQIFGQLNFTQPLSAKNQTKRTMHQKTATLPNAAVLLLNELINANEEEVESGGVAQEIQSELKHKVQSVGQTPRVERQQKVNSYKQTKPSSITIRKKVPPSSNQQQNTQPFYLPKQQQQLTNHQIRKDLHLHIDLSDDEDDLHNQQYTSYKDNQQQQQDWQRQSEAVDDDLECQDDEGACDQYGEEDICDSQDFMDMNEPVEIGLMSEVGGKCHSQDKKLRTQKIQDIQKILGNNQEQQSKKDRTINLKDHSNLQLKAIPVHFSPKSEIASPTYHKTSTKPIPLSQTAVIQQKSDKTQTNVTKGIVKQATQHKRKPSEVTSHRSKSSARRKSPPETQLSEVVFPITPAKALKLFMQHLTDYEKGEILDYKQVYFLGIGAKKIKGSPLQSYNSGYDDERGDYKVVLKDHIGFRWEVLEFLGKGSFGQALKCFDHKTKEIVCVKMIRNKKRFQHQAGVELKILQHLSVNDPDDQYNIIRIKDHLLFRKHLVISFELFSINLYEFIKNNNFQGVSLSLIRRFAIQMLQALKYLREEEIIHCDLKPENILLKSPDKSGIKIIDFGSSCFQDERIYTYIQSRFYRAPEIILGIPYTAAIDMWSFGCILVELFTGYPIFPGESEQEQLALIMEVRDVPPQVVLDQSTRKKLFFDEETDEPILVPNSRGKLRMPNTKPLQVILRSQSASFIDFIERCLDWNPMTRLNPLDALMHEWIIEGLPPKVLMHHQRMLGLIPDDQQALSYTQPQNLRYMRSQPPQTTKAGNKLSKTCLISEAFENQQMTGGSGNITKRGKSLNRTGMIVIDENEDMTDLEHCFLLTKKNKGKVEKQKHRHITNEEDDQDEIEEVEKSKTTNISDLLYQMKKQKQSNEDGVNFGVKKKMKMFENTHDISKLKKNSFFSSNNIEDQIFSNEEDLEDDDDEQEGIFLPYDERDQQQENAQGTNNNKKNKLPFSFLMHHYMKTNTGQQVAAENPNVGFYKPQGKDVKLNNYMGASNNNGNTHKQNPKKGFINLSSNI